MLLYFIVLCVNMVFFERKLSVSDMVLLLSLMKRQVVNEKSSYKNAGFNINHV